MTPQDRTSQPDIPHHKAEPPNIPTNSRSLEFRIRHSGCHSEEPCYQQHLHGNSSPLHTHHWVQEDQHQNNIDQHDKPDIATSRKDQNDC